MVALGAIVLASGRADESAAHALVERLGGRIETDQRGRLIRVDLSGTAVRDDEIAMLADLRHLQAVDLSHSAITDRGLAILRDGRAPLDSIVVPTGSVSEAAASWFPPGVVCFGTPQHPAGD